MQETRAWKWRRKNRLKKEKRAKQNDKIQKSFAVVFAKYKFDWTTRQNLKKGSEKTQKKREKVQENCKN